MLVTTKQKMYLTMHGLVDKGETIDIPEDVINILKVTIQAMKIHQMKILATKSLRKQTKRKPILRKNK